MNLPADRAAFVKGYQSGGEPDCSAPTISSDRVLETVGDWAVSAEALHVRLTTALRQGIATGELRPGGRLPSERVLARTLNVSRTTAVSAYNALQAEGLIQRREGSGTYVCAKNPLASRFRPELFSSAQTTSFNEPDLPDHDNEIEFTSAVFPGEQDVLTSALDGLATVSRQLFSSLGYSAVGSPELRDLIASYLTARDLPSRSDEILITSGAQQAISLIATLLLDTGDIVLTEDPTWVGALDAFRACGAKLVSVPVDAQGVQTSHCRDLAMRYQPRFLYLTPTFHNPTGALLSDHRRRDLATIARDTGLLIIEDNTLAELGLADHPPPPIAAYAPGCTVFAVGSFSKLFWGGLRVGWIRAPSAAIVRLAHLKLAMDHGSSLLSQALAAALLPNLDRAKKLRRADIERGINTLTQAIGELLPSWTWSYPKGGSSLWVRLPAGDATEFSQFALRHGVRLVPGPVFSANRQHPDCIRIPYVLPPGQLREGVERLARAWAQYINALNGRALRELII